MGRKQTDKPLLTLDGEPTTEDIQSILHDIHCILVDEYPDTHKEMLNAVTLGLKIGMELSNKQWESILKE